ncbi:hypothetical protein B566_EDAN014066 [Ephemera danica]|nr:hypothetical protein B566_EDAN014066 [Ephemera danica]
MKFSKVILLLLFVVVMSAKADPRYWLDYWYHQDDRPLLHNANGRLEDCPTYYTDRLQCYSYWRYSTDEATKVELGSQGTLQQRAFREAADHSGPGYVLYKGKQGSRPSNPAGAGKPQAQGRKIAKVAMYKG